jgi:hypothetical protein
MDSLQGVFGAPFLERVDPHLANRSPSVVDQANLDSRPPNVDSQEEGQVVVDIFRRFAHEWQAACMGGGIR